MNEKKQKKIFLTIIFIIVLILAILLIKYFNAIACHFYGVTSQANGQLLGTVLTAIGGCAVIYGLYLNNKRIKEQNRQNNIADKTNNDKRFGDAIGYLNSDNAGVAIGAVYALYQLAKEDERYKSIVANVFVEELSKVNEPDLKDRKYKLIFDTIFTATFNSERLIISRMKISNVNIDSVYNKVFKDCDFTTIKIHNITDSIFTKTKVTFAELYSIGELILKDSIINECVIFSLDSASKIYIQDSKIAKSKIAGLEINYLSLCSSSIKDSLKIIADKIGYLILDLEDAEKVIISTNKIENLNVTGVEKESIKIVPYTGIKSKDSKIIDNVT